MWTSPPSWKYIKIPSKQINLIRNLFFEQKQATCYLTETFEKDIYCEHHHSRKCKQLPMWEDAATNEENGKVIKAISSVFKVMSRYNILYSLKEGSWPKLWMLRESGWGLKRVARSKTCACPELNRVHLFSVALDSLSPVFTNKSAEECFRMHQGNSLAHPKETTYPFTSLEPPKAKFVGLESNS